VRALVTGAGGFLGRYVVDDLLGRGHAVSALVRPGSPVPAAWEGRDVQVVRADLRRPGAELGDAVRSADAVVHLAATTAGTWRSMFDTTVTATKNLLDLIGERPGGGGRLVHASSFSVYGLNQVPRGAVVDEDTPLEPHPERRDDYAWTKWLQERLVRDFRDAGTAEVAIVRPGVIYGRERRFQHQLGREVGSGLLLYGGLVRMRLTYVENTASLLAECVENPLAAGETFNAVDPRPLRQWEYAREWRRLGDGSLRIVPLPLWPLRLLGSAISSPPSFIDPYRLRTAYGNFRYDTDRATRVLGWQPPVSREDALRRSFAPSEGE
jgi:nucleoside-diphosphate-sugar epimerase